MKEYPSKEGCALVFVAKAESEPLRSLTGSYASVNSVSPVVAIRMEIAMVPDYALNERIHSIAFELDIPTYMPS